MIEVVALTEVVCPPLGQTWFLNKSQVAPKKKKVPNSNSEFTFDLCCPSLVYLERCYTSSCPGKRGEQVYKGTTLLSGPMQRNISEDLHYGSTRTTRFCHSAVLLKQGEPQTPQNYSHSLLASPVPNDHGNPFPRSLFQNFVCFIRTPPCAVFTVDLQNLVPKPQTSEGCWRVCLN